MVRDSVIFGIPLDPTDSTNNAMIPVSGISLGRDIDFDDQEQFVYWVQSIVSEYIKLNKQTCRDLNTIHIEENVWLCRTSGSGL